MKKSYAKRLNEIASKLPMVFKSEQDYIVMTSEELALTPVADIIKLEPGKQYQIPIPKYTSVYHEAQLKDAFKRGGLDAVNEYVKSVMANENRVKIEQLVNPNYITS